MAITRITATWTGFNGAPGYSNFFFNAFGGGDVVDLEVGRVRAFFNALAIRLPSSVTVNVDGEAAVLDEASGELIGYANASEQPAAVIGSGSGSYSGPSGAVIHWQTDAVAKGRRLRGRTFLVPLSGAVYESDGTLTAPVIEDIQDAADLLIGDGTGPELVVWSRPVDGAGGTIGTVTGHRVPDMAAVLRSRRD